VVETRKQLREVCIRLKIDLESCQAESVAIRKALLAGLFVNVAERNKVGEACLAPDSSLNRP